MNRTTKGLAAASLSMLLVGTSIGPARGEEGTGTAASVESGMQRAGDATKRGLDKAGSATGNALEKALDETGKGVGYAIDETGKGLKKAGDSLSGSEGSASEDASAE